MVKMSHKKDETHNNRQEDVKSSLEKQNQNQNQEQEQKVDEALEDSGGAI